MEIKDAITGIVLGIVALIAINHFENKFIPKYIEPQTVASDSTWEPAFIPGPGSLNWEHDE